MMASDRQGCEKFVFRSPAAQTFIIQTPPSGTTPYETVMKVVQFPLFIYFFAVTMTEENNLTFPSRAY